MQVRNSFGPLLTLNGYVSEFIMKYMYLILGIVLILNGSLVINNPRFYSSKYDKIFDFTGIEWPYGGIQIVIGLVFVWTVFRKKDSGEYGIMMCPKCIKPFDAKNLSSKLCPVCKTEMEDIKGFYERKS